MDINNADDLQRAIEEDERQDALQLATHMSVREYAKAHSIAPQLVYYYIRRGRIAQTFCVCGRKVIDIKEADEIFNPKEETDGDASD